MTFALGFLLGVWTALTVLGVAVAGAWWCSTRDRRPEATPRDQAVLDEARRFAAQALREATRDGGWVPSRDSSHQRDVTRGGSPTPPTTRFFFAPHERLLSDAETREVWLSVMRR